MKLNYLRIIGLFVFLGSLLPLQQLSAADSVTITLWDYHTTDKAALDNGIAIFQAANPSIKVKLVQKDIANYGNDLNIAFYQGQQAPDLFAVVPETQIPFHTQVANRWLAPLNDFPDFAAFKATFPKSDFNFDVNFVEGQNVLDGKAYTAALERPLPPLFLYVNTNLYRKAGLTNADGSIKAPTTIDALIDNSQAIKNATGKAGLGFAGLSGVEDFWWLCQLSGPYSVDNKPGWDATTGHYAFSSKVCFQKMIDSLLKMRDAQLVVPDSATSTDSTLLDLFAKGEVAHYLGDLSTISALTKIAPGFSSVYTILPLPLINAPKPTTFFYTTPGGRWMAINANSKVKDAAWKLFRFLYSKDYQDLWTRQGNGLGLFTSQSTIQSALFSSQKTTFEMAKLVIFGPDSTLRRPDLSNVKVVLSGPSPAEVLMDIYTGKTTDIEGALLDLDKRSETALDLAIANANSSGIKVTRKDFIFEDWNASLPYIPKPSNGPTPSDIIPNNLTPTGNVPGSADTATGAAPAANPTSAIPTPTMQPS